MKITQAFFLLASVILFCNSAIISEGGNSAAPAVTYTDIPINISSPDTSLAADIYPAFLTLNETYPFVSEAQLVAAFLRISSDGDKFYFLYIDAADEKGLFREFEGIVKVNQTVDPAEYSVVGFREVAIEGVSNSNSNLSVDGAAQVSLAAFVDGLAKEYTKLSVAAVQTDANLASGIKEVQGVYALTNAASLFAVYFRSQTVDGQTATASVLFFLGTGSKANTLWSVTVFSAGEQSFVGPLTRILVPANVKN